MILSTDVYTSEPVWVVELIPFPALPEDPVSGNFDSFKTIIDIINTWGIQPEGGDVNDDGNVDILDALMVAQYYVGLYTFLPHLAGGDANLDGSVDIVDALMIAQVYVGLLTPGWQPSSGEIEILFSEETGVHNLTGLFVTDAQALIDAARSLLEEKESEIDVSWDELKSLSEFYLSQGLEYWVIDLLELGISKKSREPVIYTFQSENLYFPLKISSAATGRTIISLFTFSAAPLTILKDEEGRSPRLWTRGCVRELYITPEDLASIEPTLVSLFNDEVKVGFYQYSGFLQELETDFKAE